MLACHELCMDDMIDVYIGSISDEEYSNVDIFVEKIVLHSDMHRAIATERCQYASIVLLGSRY